MSDIEMVRKDLQAAHAAVMARFGKTSTTESEAKYPPLLAFDRIVTALEDQQKKLQEAETALILADGSLTWCGARHRNGSRDAEVLHEAIVAVTRITRNRG